MDTNFYSHNNSLAAAFGQLNTAIRYIASGFISLVVFCFLRLDFTASFPSISNDALVIILFIVAIGIFIYAVHVAFFDKIFYRFVILIYIRRNQVPGIIMKNIEDWRLKSGKLDNKNSKKTTMEKNRRKKKHAIKCKEISFALFSQGYLRKVSLDVRVKSIQAEIDNRLALLMFLYCSCYSLLFIPLMSLFHILISEITLDDTLGFKYFCTIILGVIVSVLAITFDYRILQREIWAVEYFPEG